MLDINLRHIDYTTGEKYMRDTNDLNAIEQNAFPKETLLIPITDTIWQPVAEPMAFLQDCIYSDGLISFCNEHELDPDEISYDFLLVSPDDNQWAKKFIVQHMGGRIVGEQHN